MFVWGWLPRSVLLFSCVACAPEPPQRLPHDAYIWQRRWTNEVVAAMRQSSDLVRTWRVLAAASDAQGHLRPIAVDWATLVRSERALIPVFRIEGQLTNWDEDALRADIHAVLSQWREHRLSIAGIEIDHDCGTAKLPTYARFLKTLRAQFNERRPLSITTLPAWLSSPAFLEVLTYVDEIVLQVHAVQNPRAGLFDAHLAREWVDTVSRQYSVPFRVALPTYGSRVSWGLDGSLLTVESEAALLTGGDAAVELLVSPQEIATFLRTLERDPPPRLAGIVWFRLPAATDRRAWSLATWHAVIAGKPLLASLDVQAHRSDTPGMHNLVLINQGDIDAELPRRVELPATCTLADGINGYTLERAALSCIGDTRGSCAANISSRLAGCGVLQIREKFMSIRKQLGVGLAVVCLGVSIALACGPNFPWQLLDNRVHTLKSTPTNSFAFEVKRLVPPPSDQLRAIEYQDRHAVEVEGLSAGHADTIQRMREVATGDEAAAIGGELPAAIRLYTAGAAAFLKADESKALTWFQSVLALPEEEQRARATWAAYMIGRSYARLGDVEKAAEAFRQTRTLALAGVPDPLGLAVASYGEEAKLHLDRAKNSITGGEVSAEQTQAYAGEMATAVTLYAEQEARGSQGGVQSLRMVAEHLLYKTPERLAAVVADSAVQRLLVAYVLAHESDSAVQMSAPNNESPRSPVSPNSLVVTLVEAIVQRDLAQVTGVDRLAALAYRIGRYDLAARLTATAPGPLVAWVKAKLALQKGNLATAATFYAEAAKAFPSLVEDEGHTLESANVRLLTGERGVLTLARGEYVEALAQLYPVAATYWGDVAYLAERVLTVDELQHFVDTKVPPSPIVSTAQKTQEHDASSEDAYAWLSLSDPATRLRDLLARRLVRNGRYQEALAYFPPPNEKVSTDPYIQVQVKAYAQALEEAEHGWWPVERAQAWQQAAILARKFGMEMMGYSTAPDFSAHGGNFTFGRGHTPSTGPFVTKGELRRFAASTAKPNLRFHYRYRAVEHSLRAAELLPPRSQAFAAVLCRATGWMLSTDTQHARYLYRRYVQAGAYVPWAAHFGRNCPEPDFKAATRMAKRQPFHDAGQFARQYRLLIGGGLVAGIGAILVLRARQMAAE